MSRKYTLYDLFMFLALGVFIGIGITVWLKAFPTEPSDWNCEASVTGLADGYSLCRTPESKS